VEIIRNGVPTARAPESFFTGVVLMETVAVPRTPSRTGANLARFSPGARTHWHTHPLGQTLYVTEGIGRCQREGGRVEELRPGDRVYFDPGENHWHGAAPDRFMTHLAIQEFSDDGPVVWGDPVTDAQYLG
jgi:quercetin dioxygenase-like cupin family protein